MAKKRQRNEWSWDCIGVLVPHGTERAVRKAAAQCEVDVNHYMQSALLLRLEADGVRLRDYMDEAA
jgi:hypothetical protein